MKPGVPCCASIPCAPVFSLTSLNMVLLCFPLFFLDLTSRSVQFNYCAFVLINKRFFSFKLSFTFKLTHLILSKISITQIRSRKWLNYIHNCKYRNDSFIYKLVRKGSVRRKIFHSNWRISLIEYSTHKYNSSSPLSLSEITFTCSACDGYNVSQTKWSCQKHIE